MHGLPPNGWSPLRVTSSGQRKRGAASGLPPITDIATAAAVIRLRARSRPTSRCHGLINGLISGRQLSLPAHKDIQIAAFARDITAFRVRRRILLLALPKAAAIASLETGENAISASGTSPDRPRGRRSVRCVP